MPGLHSKAEGSLIENAGETVGSRLIGETASASDLDPQISVTYADLQVARVAKQRGMDTATVENLVSKYTTGRTLGFIGEPAVNGLELNVALDQTATVKG